MPGACVPDRRRSRRGRIGSCRERRCRRRRRRRGGAGEKIAPVQVRHSSTPYAAAPLNDTPCGAPSKRLGEKVAQAGLARRVPGQFRSNCKHSLPRRAIACRTGPAASGTARMSKQQMREETERLVQRGIGAENRHHQAGQYPDRDQMRQVRRAQPRVGGAGTVPGRLYLQGMRRRTNDPVSGRRRCHPNCRSRRTGAG